MTATRTRKTAPKAKAAQPQPEASAQSPYSWWDATAAAADHGSASRYLELVGGPIDAETHFDAAHDACGQATAEFRAETHADCERAYHRVLGGTPPWETATFADPEPWQCPACRCLLERPGAAHGCHVTEDPSGSERTGPAPVLDSGILPEAAGPGPEGQPLGELDPADAERFGTVYGDGPGDAWDGLDDLPLDYVPSGAAEDPETPAAARLGSPAPAETTAPGPEPSPGAPGPGVPGEVPDFPDRDGHESALDQDGSGSGGGGGQEGAPEVLS